MSAPRFSLVVVHDDRRYGDAQLAATLASLAAQTERGFEVVLLHDGPLSRPPPDPGVLGDRLALAQASATRGDDFGNTLRAAGLGAARGEYVLQLEPGDRLSSDALATLAREADLPPRRAPASLPRARENPAVLVFTVRQRGVVGNGRVVWNVADRSRSLLYNGLPAAPGNIHCMQLAARRALWPAIGGWSGATPHAYATLYQRLIAAHGARYVAAVLGERG